MQKAHLAPYIIGFASSVALTLLAYFVVLHPGVFHMASANVATAIIALAVIQLAIQMIYFLHLGAESGSRWRLAIFVSTISIIVIVVIGSLWIMDHLNYNMTSAQMQKFIQSHEGGI